MRASQGSERGGDATARRWRARLFEFCDQPWAPSLYHTYLRVYISFFYRIFKYYRLWLAPFADFMRQSGSRRFLECCSGSGEALRLLVGALPDADATDKRFVMSDLFPLPRFVQQINRGGGERFSYHPEPVDVRNIQQQVDSPRIFINAFHHFAPAEAREILRDSVRGGQGLVLMEYCRHAPMAYLSVMLGTLLFMLTVPWVVKLRDLPLMVLGTYVIPVFPCMMLWDGLVSCYRTYTPAQIEALLAETGTRAQVIAHTRRGLSYPAGATTIAVLPAARCDLRPGELAA